MKKVKLVVLLALIAKVSVSQLTLGLVGHYTFAGDAADASTYANDGTIQGAVLTTDRFGTPNSAYEFDGVSDVIVIGAYTNMSPTEALSVAAWIKTNSAAGSPAIYDRLETGDGFGLRLNGAGKLRLTINGGVMSDVISTTVIDDGVWHCVVGTYDRNAGMLKVYVDGVLEGTEFSTEFIDYMPEPRNSIGGVGGTAHVYFDGSIDEVRIYERALTLAEIEELCEATSGKPTAVAETGQQLFDLLLAPNPTAENVAIHCSENINQIDIYDFQGRIIKTINGSNSGYEMIDVASLAQGTYFIYVTTPKGVSCQKLMKI
jgi:hypothetical protein